MRARHLLFLAVPAAAAVAVIPCGAAAQTLVRGTLVDDATGEALAGATVVISTNRGRWQRSVRTDGVGGWRFESVAAGPYRLRSTRLGYREVAGDVAVAGDSLLEVHIRMSAEAVVLAPLTVVARQEPQVSPVLQGFYARLRRGPGRFVTRAEIEERQPSRVSDLLRGIPNLTVGASRGSPTGGVLSRGSASGRCSVVVFVDGMRLNVPTPSARGPQNSPVPIDDYVHPLDVEGVEIYRGESDTPAEFATRWVSCGTVVIWTRRGGRR